MKNIECNSVIGRMSKQGHHDKIRAVNFHLTMAMRERQPEGETDILSSQQMSVTVENVMSLSLPIFLAALSLCP